MAWEPLNLGGRAGAQLLRGDDARGLHGAVPSVWQSERVNGCDVWSQFRGEWLLFNHFLIPGIARC